MIYCPLHFFTTVGTGKKSVSWWVSWDELTAWSNSSEILTPGRVERETIQALPELCLFPKTCKDPNLEWNMYLWETLTFEYLYVYCVYTVYIYIHIFK